MDRRTIFLPTACLSVLLCAATGKSLPPAPWGDFGPNPAYPNVLGPAYPMKQGPLINAFDYPGPDTVPNYWYSGPHSADGSFYYKATDEKKIKKSKKLDSDKKLGKYGKRDMFDAPLGYDTVPNLTPAYCNKKVSDFLDKLFDALKSNKTALSKAKRDGGLDNFEDESEDRARRQHARAVSVKMHQGYQSLPAGAVESVQAGGGAVPGHQGGGIKLFDTNEYEDSFERFDWPRYLKDEREKHKHHRNRH